MLAPPVAEKVFVGALTHLHDGRAAPLHELREKVERDADIVRNGLVLQPHEQRQERLHLLPVDQRLVMIRLVSTGDSTGELKLVVALLALVPNRERRHRPWHQLAHEGHVHR